MKCMNSSKGTEPNNSRPKRPKLKLKIPAGTAMAAWVSSCPSTFQTLKKKHNLDNGFLREIGLEHLEMYILCYNCLRLIKKKMHPSNNEQNCLTLENIPDELDLVDLEQQLIARSLLFIKVKKSILWDSPKFLVDQMDSNPFKTWLGVERFIIWKSITFPQTSSKWLQLVMTWIPLMSMSMKMKPFFLRKQS